MSILRNNDYFIEVSAGRVPNKSILTVLGQAPDIDTAGTPADIWPSPFASGLYTGWVSSANTVDVYSDNANDTILGTGARQVLIQGLDENYLPISEVLDLDGTTKVTSLNSYLRITSSLFNIGASSVASAGTSKTNEGTLTVEVTGVTASVMDIVTPLSSSSRAACFTVPAGETYYITGLFFTFNDNNSNTAQGVFVINDNITGVEYQVLPYSLHTEIPLTIPTDDRFPLTEKQDFCGRILDVENNNADISLAMSMVKEIN